MSVTQVKSFHSGMAGAPVLNNAPGSLIAVLDACLVNGWGSATVDSVVISGGVVTVTRGAGHPFEPDSVVELGGATVSGGSINGQHKVTAATNITYSFPAPAGVGAQTAIGTISHKVAAAGWTKPLSGTHLAAYRMDALEGIGHYLWVDDTDAHSARVRGFGSMSDINTGADPYPTETQSSGGGWWVRTNEAGSATGRAWAVYADAVAFVLAIQYSSSFPQQMIAGYFGQIRSRKQPDPWASALFASTFDYRNNSPASVDAFHVGRLTSAFGGGAFVSRGVAGLGGAMLLTRGATTPAAGGLSGRSGSFGFAEHVQYPNPADNAFYVSPIYLGDVSPVLSARGVLPGVYYVPQRIGPDIFPNRSVVTGIDAYPGRRFRALDLDGPTLVDVTGPWR